jgi:hypothetical protein
MGDKTDSANNRGIKLLLIPHSTNFKLFIPCIADDLSVIISQLVHNFMHLLVNYYRLDHTIPYPRFLQKS